MAKDAKTEAIAIDAPKKRSSKLLIIIVLLLVIALAIAGATGFFLLKMSHANDADDDEAAAEPAPKPKKKAPAKDALPVYVPLEAFTVNLVPEAEEQFVQLVLSVEVDDAESGEQIKAYTPKIRNNVMMLLSSKKASELLTREGKEKLAEEIREQMNQVLSPRAKPNEGPVREVLFTSFIIQ
ncbi:MAG: flagellar basal body-associated protein FliL [Candidatus Accumulibacter sp.]|jgi:flagellar FliL protein|nr:flagellar basal body-associated protein FliL [Accumulibacter sp.]